MKINFIFYVFLLSSIKLFAQPGDVCRYRAERVTQVSGLLATDSNNYELVWERIELIFDPYFDIYTKPFHFEKEQSFDRKEAFYYKDIDVLGEINKLIKNNFTMKILGGRTNGIDHITHVSKADFYYKRGQYYYLKNEKTKALEDYLIALNSNPGEYLKNRICISLAAYYYNLNEKPAKKDLEKALMYIDKVTPIQYETKPRIFEYYSDSNFDIYEREKIMLLKNLGEKERLVGYYKNISKSNLILYIREKKEPEDYQKEHSFTIQQSLEYGLEYLNYLSDYYKEIGDIKKSENVKNKIKSCDKNVKLLLQLVDEM